MRTSSVRWKPAFALIHGNTLQGVFNVTLCLLPFSNLISTTFLCAGQLAKSLWLPCSCLRLYSKEPEPVSNAVRPGGLRVVYR